MKQVIVSSPSSLAINTFCANISTSWVLNDVGASTIEIPIDKKDTLLDLGNFIIVTDDVLPAWAGVVLQVGYSPNGVAKVDLKSLDWLLSGLCSPQGYVVEGPIGPAAERLLWESGVKQGITRLRAAQNGMTAGGYTWATYDYTPLFEIIKKWSDEGKADWWVNEKAELNIVTRRGNDFSLRVFEGTDPVAISSVMEDRSNIITANYGMGQGNDVLSKPKKFLYINSAAPWRVQITDYSNISFSPGEEYKMEEPIKYDLNRLSQPQYRVDLDIRKDFLASNHIWLGDTFYLVTKTIGELRVKVLGVESTSSSDICRMIVETIPTTFSNPVFEWRY